MRVTVITSLAGMLIAWSIGFANQANGQQYKNGVSRMFLDAHTPAEPTYSRTEINQMIHAAKTSGDFKRLADYFAYRSMEFDQKSQEQTKELERLLALRYHARTYQAQVDYTRELIKRYKAEAKDCTDRADGYREQATTGVVTK
jgi:hypothetical protein